MEPFQTSGTVTKKVVQGHHTTSTSAQYCYLALRARRYRWKTTPQLNRDVSAVSERRISRQIVYSHLPETGLPLSSLMRPFDNIQQERPDIVKLKTSVVDITRMGAFQW
ncbi:hypothetical protein TNCV_1532101 [Trichonephila clavipes]|nr:hypothetical protein TNCV_1532101 [Trichonephila clavipes]